MNSNPKPIVFSCRSLPISSLNPGEFEGFVFASLICISPHLGFLTTGKPSGTGDGGFDVEGTKVIGKGTVCVQCKRQEEPLGTPLIAEELAKVAATSNLASSVVVEHRFICSGGVRESLRKLLRDPLRKELKVQAGDRIVNATSGPLSSLREQLKSCGREPRSIVEAYVENLERIVVWDLHEFQVSLTLEWTKILEISESFFQIQHVVIEHPRAVFDRQAYVDRYRGLRLVIEPRLAPADLPFEMSRRTGADPGAPAVVAQKNLTETSGFLALELGSLAIVTGHGGSGKTELLRLIRARILQECGDSSLPILFSLGQYTAGHLDRVIHQELGVMHGTWRSLPDKIFLLCDGLNERNSTIVRELLTELKPLLEGKNVVCILATRDGSRRSMIVLPDVTCTCVSVQSITPMAIARLAQDALCDGSDASFVRSYRSVADISGSSLMWTPFAVRVALKLWKETTELPTSLGQMLEILLRLRCQRNSEQELVQLDPEVVLLLAGALAFQTLIIEGNMECQLAQAGRWIQSARLRCDGALGIRDLRDHELIELLTAHDLLRAGESEYFSFEHQLTAGALAAPLLAQDWRLHVQSLRNGIADDAWVFAARLVPEDEVLEYLDTILNEDLILGGRSARDLSPRSRRHVFSRLMQIFEEETAELLRSQGLFALAALASDDAVNFLKKSSKMGQERIRHVARAALASIGDLSTLKELLDHAELMGAAPIHVSGGDIDLWRSAPMALRLDVARQRLAQHSVGDVVGESLMLIAFERDPSDAELIERHLVAAKDIAMWGKALHALNAVAPERARVLAIEEISQHSSVIDRARLITMAFLVRVNVDVHTACDCVLSEDALAVESPQDQHYLFKLITDVIANLAVPPSVIDTVAKDLSNASGLRREYLWHLAYECKNSAIADHAVRCIEKWNDEVWAACNYLLRHIEYARDRKAALIEACMAGLEADHQWWSPHVAKASELIAALETSDQFVAKVSLIVSRLNRIRQAIEDDLFDGLQSKEQEVLAGYLPNIRPYVVAGIAGSFLPSVASVRKELSDDLLTHLLKFDFSSSSTEHDLRDVLRDCSAASIDAILGEIDDELTLAKSLVTVCSLGLTEMRLQILDRLIRNGYQWPAMLHQLTRALESCWSSSVSRMIARAVADIEDWPDNAFQFFGDIVRLGSNKVTEEDEAIIVESLGSANTENAKRVLNIWRACASGKRIGLAAFESSQ